jgi:hypothetical protein
MQVGHLLGSQSPGTERERRERELAPTAPEQARELAATIGNQAFASLARTGRVPLPQQRASGPQLQRFVESEHKMIGDLGSSKGPALAPTLELAPGFKVTYGDMVAMSGDWFGSVKELTDLAKVEGKGPGTREEVEYVLAIEIHGEKDREKEFSEAARIAAKARYYALAADNSAHFANPYEGDRYRDIHEAAAAKEGGKPLGAAANYHDNHVNALIEAARAGKAGEPKNQALMLESFSNHFLTDSFSSGHLRTPRKSLQQYWHAKVPMFFTNFKMYMAETIAQYVNDHNWRGVLSVDTLMYKGEGALPAGALPTIEAKLRAKRMPPLTFGDIVSGALHDYDNLHGVNAYVDGHYMQLLGDSQLIEKGKATERGAPTMIAAANAVRASLDEVEEAYEHGLSPDDFLNRNGGIFAAEAMIPQVAPELEQESPEVRWQFDSAERLLQDPGFQEAVQITAHDKASELEGIGKELDEEYTRDAFFNGFLVKLQGNAQQVAATLQEVIDYTPGTGGGLLGHDEDAIAEDYFKLAKNNLGTLTLKQKTKLVHDVLTGATLGSEDAMIVDLLDANHADGAKIIEHFGWHWIWTDVDGDDCRNFIRRLGPAFWSTQSMSAKKKEVRWLADGVTTDLQEETIVVILRTCTPAEVREIDKAAGGLDWDLTDEWQDELDRLREN